MVHSVLITGCSEGGIGDYLAREFHSRGFRVFASGRDPAKLEKLRQLGLETLPLDVTSAESIEAAAKEIGNKTGGILDVLINNSGSGTRQVTPSFAEVILTLALVDRLFHAHS